MWTTNLIAQCWNERFRRSVTPVWLRLMPTPFSIPILALANAWSKYETPGATQAGQVNATGPCNDGEADTFQVPGVTVLRSGHKVMATGYGVSGISSGTMVSFGWNIAIFCASSDTSIELVYLIPHGIKQRPGLLSRCLGHHLATSRPNLRSRFRRTRLQ